MSIEIPEEQITAWREDFNLYARDFIGTTIGFDEAVEDFDEALDYVGDYVGLEGVWIAAKTSSHERELKKEIEIRDLLKSIELSHLHSEDKEAFEKILAIENLLSNDSQDKRYKFMDENEKLQQDRDYWKHMADLHGHQATEAHKEYDKLQERINLLERPDRGIDIVRGYINRIESLESQIAKGEELIHWISQQSRVRGYPTAMEWNALVNQVKKVVG